MADSKKVTTATEKTTKGTAAKTAAAVKTEAKKADKVIEEVADSEKKEEAKSEEVKKSTKETAAKVTTPKKKTTTKAATVKKTEEKAAEKEVPSKTSAKSKIAKVYVQYDSNEASQEDLLKRILDKWVAETGKKESAVKTFEVYIKPEDNAAYYVINGQGSSINLF